MVLALCVLVLTRLAGDHVYTDAALAKLNFQCVQGWGWDEGLGTLLTCVGVGLC